MHHGSLRYAVETLRQRRHECGQCHRIHMGKACDKERSRARAFMAAQKKNVAAAETRPTVTLAHMQRAHRQKAAEECRLWHRPKQEPLLLLLFARESTARLPGKLRVGDVGYLEDNLLPAFWEPARLLHLFLGRDEVLQLCTVRHWISLRKPLGLKIRRPIQRERNNNFNEDQRC